MYDVAGSVITVVDVVSRALPVTLLATVLTLYFGFRKLGHKIQVSFSVVGHRYSKSRLSSIILVNKKDRVEIISRISVRFNGRYRLHLAKFPEPRILRPFEAIKIDTEEATDYLVGSESIDLLQLIQQRDIVFEIASEDRIIQTKAKRAHGKQRLRPKRRYIEIAAVREIYNGKVINESVIYAIIYKENNSTMTAFVDDSGFIGGDWEFGFNALTRDQIKDKDTVKATLMKAGIMSYVTNVAVDDLRESFWKRPISPTTGMNISSNMESV